MEEKRIISLIEGSKEDHDNGRALRCTSVFSHEVEMVRLERNCLFIILRRNEKSIALTIKNETQAVAAYSSILKFLVNSEKLLHVFSE